MEQFLWIVWLVVFVLALIIEWATAEVVSIWFAFSAIVSLVLSFIPGVEWWVEVVVFVVLSAAQFAFLRPCLKKLMRASKSDTNIDEIIGKKGYMIEEYTDTSYGAVKINGVIWTAINTKENETIVKGTKVQVMAIEGNKLIVKTIKED